MSNLSPDQILAASVQISTIAAAGASALVVSGLCVEGLKNSSASLKKAWRSLERKHNPVEVPADIASCKKMYCSGNNIAGHLHEHFDQQLDAEHVGTSEVVLNFDLLDQDIIRLVESSPKTLRDKRIDKLAEDSFKTAFCDDKLQTDERELLINIVKDAIQYQYIKPSENEKDTGILSFKIFINESLIADRLGELIQGVQFQDSARTATELSGNILSQFLHESLHEKRSNKPDSVDITFKVNGKKSATSPSVKRESMKWEMEFFDPTEKFPACEAINADKLCRSLKMGGAATPNLADDNSKNLSEKNEEPAFRAA